MKETNEFKDINELNAVYILYNLATKHLLDYYSTEQNNTHKEEMMNLVHYCFSLLIAFVDKYKGKKEK